MIFATKNHMHRATIEHISPFLVVNHVDQTMALYLDNLGFETRFQEPATFTVIDQGGVTIIEFKR